MARYKKTAWMRGEGVFYRDVTSRPYPVAARDKLREPRGGDFVRQSPGCRGQRRLAAPCALPAPVTLYGIAH